MNFPSEKSPQARIRNVLDDVEIDIKMLAGDASERVYYRVSYSNDQSVVVALLPDPFNVNSLPYLNVSKLFSEIPIRVPKIITVDGDSGVLVLEDLGDDLLQDIDTLEPVGLSKRELYSEAMDILVRLQKRATELRNEQYIPFQIAFDEDKFFAELHFFQKYFLEAFLGANPTESEKTELDFAFRNLAIELCDRPFALCHRDYHSRNIMLNQGSLVVIDFQDARRGPAVYDAVSLLNDSYVRHTPEFISEMMESFQLSLGISLLGDYDITALQRNLKALGTFGFQITKRNKVFYKRYIEHTLLLVRNNLARNPKWDSLRRILARYCDEIGS